MSVKKTLIISAAAALASAGSVAALAGGPTHIHHPAPKAHNPFYVEGNFGYAASDWNDAISSDSFEKAAHSEGGITYGADLGYRFMKHMAVEMGWTKLPKMTALNNTAVGSFNFNKSGVTYLAAKMFAPISHHMNAFFKAGISYRYGTFTFLNTDFAQNSKIRMKEIRPVFALGADYCLGKNLSANLQYMHVLGGHTYRVTGDNNATASVVAPSANLVTVGLGYHFSV